jgi:hypothetical protein
MNRSLQILVLLSFLSVTFVTNAPAIAQSPGKSKPLDQQLLDDLDRELLKGLPSAKSPPTSRGENRANEENDKSKNPLANLAERMRGVQSRIARRDTSPATQSEQTQILSELDALLEQTNKSRQAGGKRNGSGTAQTERGSGDAAAGTPRDSTNRIERGDKQPTESVDVKDVLRRIWGHLPDKLRDEMQASFSEQFLPKYERLIEEYYKRLAEERPAAP